MNYCITFATKTFQIVTIQYVNYGIVCSKCPMLADVSAVACK